MCMTRLKISDVTMFHLGQLFDYDKFFNECLKNVCSWIIMIITYNACEAKYRIASTMQQQETSFIWKFYISLVSNWTTHLNSWMTIIFVNYVKWEMKKIFATFNKITIIAYIYIFMLYYVSSSCMRYRFQMVNEALLKILSTKFYESLKRDIQTLKWWFYFIMSSEMNRQKRLIY